MEPQGDNLERAEAGRLEHTAASDVDSDGYVVANVVMVAAELIEAVNPVPIQENQPSDPGPVQRNGNADDDRRPSCKSLGSARIEEPPDRSSFRRESSAGSHQRTNRTAGASQQQPHTGCDPQHVDPLSVTARTSDSGIEDGRRNAQVALPSASVPEHAIAKPVADKKVSFHEKYGRQINLMLSIVIIVLLSLLVWAIATRSKGEERLVEGIKKEEDGDESTSVVSTLELVAQRDKLRCGVTAGIDGFSQHNLDTDTLEGFEVDLCRAVAAAVLGDGDKVELVMVTPTNRFTGLANGDVDLLASHNTLTMDRDVYVPAASTGFTFSVPYLYDGLVFAGQPAFVDCAESGSTTGDCEGLDICVVEGTTYTDIVTKFLPGASIQGRPSPEKMYERFLDPNGGCNVIAGGLFEVAESVVFHGRHQAPDQEYKVGDSFLSFEPLALMTRDGDPTWSDMVQWVLQALLSAEEQSILKVDAARFETNPDLGESFTLQFQNAIAAVGNYGEVYARHLERILPRGDVNKINEENSGDGLIFSYPFGSLDTNGPGPVDGGTLEAIRKRGHLRCGITRTPGFAEFDVESNQWTGFDVDFCKAVASAIFFGVASVEYVVLPATERFKALADGRVDMLSRITTWNLERDVMENVSFSQVNFYGGISVGGIPPYGECADKGYWLTEECKDLRVCVNRGTITIDVAQDVFNPAVLVPKDTGEQAIESLLPGGDCNAIIAGDVEVVKSALWDLGYEGNYTVGSNRFSKDPLALATRQDDPQFTSFVNWIVSATFYAEERGIVQENARDMPSVSLFGPLYRRMLADAIQSVGNYGEIYERNLEPVLPRQGRNELSLNPYPARHYTLPGF